MRIWIQIAVTEVVLGLKVWSASVLLGEWLGLGRSSLERGSGCMHCPLHEVTISWLNAIQGYTFQSGHQLGQCRAELPFGWFAHELARV